ncbi:hypothetical protein B0H19DRAFT_1075162 [Mycena capillaripes]|nr:hypothetical protein B0H19DRAFT_1075162 [Mycena capillaripes]
MTNAQIAKVPQGRAEHNTGTFKLNRVACETCNKGVKHWVRWWARGERRGDVIRDQTFVLSWLARRCFTLSTKHRAPFLSSWQLAMIVATLFPIYTCMVPPQPPVRDPCPLLVRPYLRFKEQTKCRRGSTIPKISSNESHVKTVSPIIVAARMHTSSAAELTTSEGHRLGAPFELAPRRRRFHPYKREYHARRSNSFRRSTSFDSSQYNARRLNSFQRTNSDSLQYGTRRFNLLDSSHESLAKMQNATATLGRMNHANIISMEGKLESDSRSMVEMTAALGGITLASELGTRYSRLTPVSSHVPSLASELNIKYLRPNSVDLNDRAASQHSSLPAGSVVGNLASELARCGQSTPANDLVYPRWSPIDGFSPDVCQHSFDASAGAAVDHCSPRAVNKQANRVKPASYATLDTAAALMESPPPLPSVRLSLAAFMVSPEKLLLAALMVLPDKNIGPLDNWYNREHAVEPPGATRWLIRHAGPGGYITWWLFGGCSLRSVLGMKYSIGYYHFLYLGSLPFWRLDFTLLHC